MLKPIIGKYIGKVLIEGDDTLLLQDRELEMDPKHLTLGITNRVEMELRA